MKRTALILTTILVLLISITGCAQTSGVRPTSSPTPTPTPIPIYTTIYNSVSLTSIANRKMDASDKYDGYSNPPIGKVNLGGIPFEIPVNVSNRFYFPETFSQGELQIDITNPINVYLLINAHHGFAEYRGTKIGFISFDFLDGSVVYTNLILGENIREWIPDNLFDPTVNTILDKNSQEVWRGVATNGRKPAVIDMLRIPIPPKQQTSHLIRITIKEIPQRAVGRWRPPGISLCGITVESKREVISPIVLKQQLVEKFAPILWLHPEEVYEPKDVRILVDQAVVKDKAGNVKLDMEKVVPEERLTKLGELTDPELYLDFKRINLSDGADRYAVSYANLLKNNYKTTVYARVMQEGGKTIVQYWFFYFFNDWHINHEGDWEMIQLVFDGTDCAQILNSGVPEYVYFSQHFDITGVTKKWKDVTSVKNHPWIFVAEGSHANYPQWGEYWISLPGVSIERLSDITSPDTINVLTLPDQPLTDSLRKVAKGWVKNYQLVLLPEITDEELVRKEAPWLLFKGHWGEWSLLWFNRGPSAPTLHKKWITPLE